MRLGLRIQRERLHSTKESSARVVQHASRLSLSNAVNSLLIYRCPTYSKVKYITSTPLIISQKDSIIKVSPAETVQIFLISQVKCHSLSAWGPYNIYVE